MYRIYDTFENCCYTIKKAKKVKNENTTAPPERWIFAAIYYDTLDGDNVYEELVVVKPCFPNRELSLRFAYNLKELRLNRFVQSIWDARRIYAEKHKVRIVRVASMSGNKKTIEALLGCQIG